MKIPRADSRFAPSQWETSLQSKAVSHWLGASLDSALNTCCHTLVKFAFFHCMTNIILLHIMTHYFSLTGTQPVFRPQWNIPCSRWYRCQVSGQFHCIVSLGKHYSELHLCIVLFIFISQWYGWIKQLCYSYAHIHFDIATPYGHINGLGQERRNSIANALELRLSCTNPSTYIWVDICSGNGSLSDSTESFPDPSLTVIKGVLWHSPQSNFTRHTH